MKAIIMEGLDAGYVLPLAARWVAKGRKHRLTLSAHDLQAFITHGPQPLRGTLSPRCLMLTPRPPTEIQMTMQMVSYLSRVVTGSLYSRAFQGVRLGRPGRHSARGGLTFQFLIQRLFFGDIDGLEAR